MCRLACFSGIDDEVVLAWAMVELEQSYGGHGNGVFVEKNSKYLKGEHASAAKLAAYAADESKGDGLCIFHTRLASAGGIKDELCHPFSVEGEAGAFVVAHNGHWSDWTRHSKSDERSDTQTMSRHIADQGIGVLLDPVASGSGMWLVYDCANRRQYAIRRSGEFWLQWGEFEGKPMFFHASQKVYAVQDWMKNYAKIHQDKVYEILTDDPKKFGHVRERKVQACEPVAEYAKTYSYTSGGGGYGYGSHRGRVAFSMYEVDAQDQSIEWPCYCTAQYTCGKCKTYFGTYQELPLYDDDSDYLEYKEALKEAEDRMKAEDERVFDEDGFAVEEGNEGERRLTVVNNADDEWMLNDELESDLLDFVQRKPGEFMCGADGCKNTTDGWYCEGCRANYMQRLYDPTF